MHANIRCIDTNKNVRYGQLVVPGFVVPDDVIEYDESEYEAADGASGQVNVAESAGVQTDCQYTCTDDETELRQDAQTHQWTDDYFVKPTRRVVQQIAAPPTFSVCY